MASSSERPLDHRYRNEHPIRTLGYLFRADRRHLIAAVGVLVLAGAALVSYYGVWGVTPGDVVMLSAFLSTLTNSATTLGGLARHPNSRTTRARGNCPRCTAPSPSTTSATRTTTVAGPPYATSASP